jgi:hypothetical protein
LSAALLATASAQQQTSYTVDDSAGPARLLDGIGGLSGGGATCECAGEIALIFEPNRNGKRPPYFLVLTWNRNHVVFDCVIQLVWAQAPFQYHPHAFCWI